MRGRWTLNVVLLLFVAAAAARRRARCGLACWFSVFCSPPPPPSTQPPKNKTKRYKDTGCDSTHIFRSDPTRSNRYMEAGSPALSVILHSDLFVSSGGPSPPSIRSHANIVLARASKEGRTGGPPGLLCVWGPLPSDTRLFIIPPRSLAPLALTFPYSFVFFLSPPRPLKTPGRRTNIATLFFWFCRRSHTLP